MSACFALTRSKERLQVSQLCCVEHVHLDMGGAQSHRGKLSRKTAGNGGWSCVASKRTYHLLGGSVNSCKSSREMNLCLGQRKSLSWRHRVLGSKDPEETPFSTVRGEKTKRAKLGVDTLSNYPLRLGLK